MCGFVGVFEDFYLWQCEQDRTLIRLWINGFVDLWIVGMRSGFARRPRREIQCIFSRKRTQVSTKYTDFFTAKYPKYGKMFYFERGLVLFVYFAWLAVLLPSATHFFCIGFDRRNENCF